ncbi:MAG: CoA transferase [Desulfomonile tiedjei]|nr:CoA transferase [Desulfomonile tiedjei]
MGALDGLIVLDLSRLLPGRFCTTLLADHGADVIAVEAPRFREDSLLGEVPMVMRNKRHLSLDLKSAAGRAVFFKLAEDADVLVEGFRPGVAERLGVGYDSLRERNERVIYCSMTGYGQDGPLSTRAGHDLNYMAAAGMLDMVRDRDGVPIMPNFQMAGLSGSLYATIGILLALASREQTGLGQFIDVSLTDGLVSLLAMPLAFTFSQKRLPGKLGNGSRDSFACYRVYKTRDGEFLSVGPLEPHLWTGLCTRLGCPQYGGLQYHPDRQAEITEHLDRLFRTRDLQEWLGILNHPDDCVAPVTRVADLPRDPHLEARRMVRYSGNGIPEPGIAPKLSGTPGGFRRPAYRFGEHTNEILAQLGHGVDEIRRLEQEGVIWADKTSA